MKYGAILRVVSILLPVPAASPDVEEPCSKNITTKLRSIIKKLRSIFITDPRGNLNTGERINKVLLTLRESYRSKFQQDLKLTHRKIWQSKMIDNFLSCRNLKINLQNFY
jgi:hypothetical protein